MTKVETLKAFSFKKVLDPSGFDSCRKCPDLRNVNHPYVYHHEKYADLQFTVELTRFEDGETGYGMYGYILDKTSYKEARRIYDILCKDYDKQKKHTWNSICLIGYDEKGNTFSVI